MWAPSHDNVSKGDEERGEEVRVAHDEPNNHVWSCVSTPLIPSQIREVVIQGVCICGLQFALLEFGTSQLLAVLCSLTLARYRYSLRGITATYAISSSVHRLDSLRVNLKSKNLGVHSCSLHGTRPPKSANFKNARHLWASR